ncbi:hypothetical protein QUF90_00560 [Desulfococcaceae bacterium HSG9]|nr:hypothetical protein [Desulfococcaceae bacterium HSG9]
MLNYIHSFKIILPAFMAIILSSCSATQITSVWQDDAYTVGAVKKILVKGVAKNQRDSRLFEDAFVKQFSLNGIEAFVSKRIMPDVKPEVPAEIQGDLIVEAQKRQTDALLVVHLTGVVKKTVYHPPRPLFMSMAYRDSDCRPYHLRSHFMYEPFYEPEYYTEHHFFQIESNLYNTQTAQLIWSAASETFEPTSMNALVNSVSETVIKNLRDAQLIPK